MSEGISKVISIEVVAAHTKKIIISRPKNFTFEAGQFLIIKFNKKLMRAYSIASPPSEENIELVIRIVPNGQGTSIIDKYKVGDEITISGGMGHFKLSENKNVELFFCATGTGIAPFKSMIMTEAKKENPRKITLYFGGRKKDDLAYLEEISSWAENINVKLGFSEEEQPENIKFENLQADIIYGRITPFIDKAKYSDLAEFYLCGYKGMVEGTKDQLIEKGIPKEKIFFEKFN